MAELAKELADLEVDVIVTGGPGVYRRAQGDEHDPDRRHRRGRDLVAWDSPTALPIPAATSPARLLLSELM